MVRKGEDAGIRASVRDLLEVLQTDYSKRPEREQLRLEDIRFRHKRQTTTGKTPPELHMFRPRNGNTNSESRWTLVYFIALYSSLLDEVQSDTRSVSTTGNNPRKRIRVSTHLSDNILLSTSGPIPAQISSLQTLAFMFTALPLAVDQLESVIHSLTGLVSDTVGSVATWAMLSLAG
jgi:ataxia telangiectasia mutated family protein